MDQSFGKILHNHTTSVIIVGLIFIFVIFPMIFYKLKTSGYEPFYDLALKEADVVALNDKQKLIYILNDAYNKKDPSLAADITKIINFKTITSPSTLIEQAYPLYIIRRKEITSFINEYNKNGSNFSLEFDDYFITSMEVLGIILFKNRAIDKNIFDDFKIAVENWRKVKMPVATTALKKDTITTAPIPATELEQKKANDLLTSIFGTLPLAQDKGKPKNSESVAPVTPPASLNNLTKPVSTVVNPSAGASEVSAIRTTSPGLSQGADYNKSCPQTTIPKYVPTPEHCLRPNPGTDQCSCQQPIMNDGRPFDPNQYIRKDSIPCWNCSIP